MPASDHSHYGSWSQARLTCGVTALCVVCVFFSGQGHATLCLSGLLRLLSESLPQIPEPGLLA